MTSHEEHVHGILTEIEDGHGVSQRSLSTSLGIALGLTNLLVKKVVRKGWVRAIRIKSNRVRYMLTPEGMAEKARMSTLFLQNSVRFYATARDRVRQRLAIASLEMAGLGDGQGKRIVFFGAGEVAEIAYVCLQETDLKLVGVVGENRAMFFGLPVRDSRDLSQHGLGNTPFDLLIVASFQDATTVSTRLAEVGVLKEKVFWL